MFDQNGQAILDIGTSTNVLSPRTFYSRDHPVYLTNAPYYNTKPLLHAFSILYFLSTFDQTFTFSQTKKNPTIRKIDGQLFTHHLIIKLNGLELFKVFYQSTGNHFVVQILKLHEDIHYNRKEIISGKNKRTIYIYCNPIIRINNPEIPLQIMNNKGISELSDFYNNRSVDKSKVNEITSSLFYSISPFDPKTVKRAKNLKINPNNTLEGIFQNAGGFLFQFQPKEGIDLNEYPFGVFTWFSPYFIEITNSNQFNFITTIEFDATFTALAPYAICIPQLIYRNTGIPLGLMISPSEKTSLYAMFFEALKKLDSVNQNSEDDNSLFEKFKKKKFLTDEHKAFTKLAKKYGLDMYNCYVHLIRSIGANSLLGFLLVDMLYTFSEDEWSKNILRFFYTFKLLYQEKKDPDDIRFKKVSQVLGLDPDGEPVETNNAYAPIYLRIEENVPTTTNHIESFHKHLNEITKPARFSLTLKLAYIIQYIKERTLRVNLSAHENLKVYIKNLKTLAKKEVAKDKKSKNNFTYSTCDCSHQLYYSHLFVTSVPCIHTILNDIDEKFYIQQMSENDLDFKKQICEHDSMKLTIFEIPTELTFRKRKKKTNNNNFNNNNTDGPITITRELGNIDNDILTRIILHTENQLGSVIKEFNLNYSVITTKVMFEMRKDEEVKKLLDENPQEFWALYQFRLWIDILDGRKTISI